MIERSVHDFLSRSIKSGSLELTSSCGDKAVSAVFGEPRDVSSACGRPVATIRLLNPANFYIRVAISADIGFAEAFIAEDFTVDHPDELVAIFQVLIQNRDEKKLSTTGLLISRLGAYMNRAFHVLNANSLTGSLRNIESHYDLSNELFATFLGSSWTYSCGYFEKVEESPNLDTAQAAKLDMIIAKARLTPGCHVLEIGCGWGEFAIRAAKQSGCRVTGITLSSEQLELATKRAATAGLSDRVDFKLVDYRLISRLGRKFDRVISIEMVEAVGHEFLGNYFEVLDSVLKPNGIVVLQVITTPESRYEEYRNSVDFIQKHIFPGGICPSIEALICAMAKHSRLHLEHAENIGPHYATTLREWRRRFLESAEAGLVKAAGFDAYFVRKWIYYFCYCEAGFATRTLGTTQLVLTRAGNVSTLGGPPA
jgi:cyclopropane-fatty-acyl-phospholipid synthase